MSARAYGDRSQAHPSQRKGPRTPQRQTAACDQQVALAGSPCMAQNPPPHPQLAWVCFQRPWPARLWAPERCARRHRGAEGGCAAPADGGSARHRQRRHETQRTQRSTQARFTGAASPGTSHEARRTTRTSGSHATVYGCESWVLTEKRAQGQTRGVPQSVRACHVRGDSHARQVSPWRPPGIALAPWHPQHAAADL